MQREIIITRDGSHSVSVPALNVTYHSIHGALQESIHVFIQAGLYHVKNVFPEEPLQVLEIGFGTGLNALLTLHETVTLPRSVHYTALELYPLETEEISQLNYTATIDHLQDEFRLLHNSDWEKDVAITPAFSLRKQRVNLLDFVSSPSFHVIYFDAFAPTAQPELWTKEVFEKLYASLLPSGVLVTYCSKADVRRAMVAAGLHVEKIPGPWGKREMIRAHKKI